MLSLSLSSPSREISAAGHEQQDSAKVLVSLEFISQDGTRHPQCVGSVASALLGLRSLMYSCVVVHVTCALPPVHCKSALEDPRCLAQSVLHAVITRVLQRTMERNSACVRDRRTLSLSTCSWLDLWLWNLRDAGTHCMCLLYYPP